MMIILIFIVVCIVIGYIQALVKVHSFLNGMGLPKGELFIALFLVIIFLSALAGILLLAVVELKITLNI